MSEQKPEGILTTLYAVRFMAEPSLAHLRTKQPVPIAIELQRDVAEQLVKHLQKRLEEGSGGGAIRVHLLCDVSHV